jgi:hypothetical protein
MVLGLVAFNLTSFSSYWVFMNAMRDALLMHSTPDAYRERMSLSFLAHKQAYEQADVLHRDISVGNIFITNYQQWTLDRLGSV